MSEDPGNTTVIQGILDRHAAGDEAAKDELIQYAMERLRRLARKMLRENVAVKRWNETDDVLQNALVRLHRALETERPATTQRFVGLAAEQIRRELIDLWRQFYGPHGHGAHYRSDPGNQDASGKRRPLFEEGQMDTEADEISTHEMERFHRAVGELPEQLREVFSRGFYLGMKQEEIARGFNVSTKTIKRRWRDAKLALHEQLADE